MGSFFLLASFFAVTCLNLVKAQCGGGDLPSCSIINPRNDALCGVDPNDSSDYDLWFQLCPCENAAVYTVGVTLTGTDGIVTTTTGTVLGGSSSVDQTATVDYNIPNTAIQSGSPVTMNFLEPIAPAYTATRRWGPVSWTYSPITSIYYTLETDTVTAASVTTTVTSTTTTSMATAYITQSTSTVPCTTGTLTIVASSTITSKTTSTITPSARTLVIPYISLTTVHASCISTKKALANRHNLFARQTPIVYEIPFCPTSDGSPTPTTYTTGTTYTTTTTTSTETDTSTITTTTTTTVTPTPLTTTVCNNVQATTTSTPLTTTTILTTLKRSLVLSTKTYIFTKTVFPNNHPQPCGAATITHKAPHLGIIPGHTPVSCVTT